MDAPPLLFVQEQRFLTDIRIRFLIDGVAGEMDESFTVTFTGLRPNSLEFGATINQEFVGTILDADGELMAALLKRA